MDATDNATRTKIARRPLKIHLGKLGGASGSDVATGATKFRGHWGGGNPLNNVNT
jgi:hypothetical protein